MPKETHSHWRHAPLSDLARYEMLLAGLDLLDQGVTVFDADLKLVVWNEPFLKLLDFPAELAYVGAPFESFIRFNAERGEYGGGSPAEIKFQIEARIERARSFEPHITDRQRPNGRHLRLRGAPLPHRGFITLYSDTTDQRRREELAASHQHLLEDRVLTRTEQLANATANLSRIRTENDRIAEALKRAEERLRLINDTIPTMIGYVDQHEIYRYANPGYSRWFGGDGLDVVGNPVRDVVGHDLYQRVAHHIADALNGRQVTYEYAIDRQGQTVHARSTLVPETDADGRVLGFFVFSSDISEEKRMQAALIHAQKMEAIGQLTGGLAHDFNNLLTVVIGNLAALRERQPDDEALTHLVDPALKSARRGVQLIQRLLTFARQGPASPQTTDVNALIRDMTELVRRSLPESIYLDLQVPRTPLLVRSDPAQLEAALLNFALNGRDAMPRGGRLEIISRPSTLTQFNAEFDLGPGDYARIDVIDTGCGMNADTLARVFEPFFTTKPRGLGSGLGLAMVFDYLRQAGGGIRIRSHPGHGTQVTVLLPQMAAEPETDEQPGQPLLAEARGGLVLLVEDQTDVRRVIRQQLIDLGHPVIEAEDGRQALELIEQVDEIAWLVSDIVMPGGLSGPQLAREARALRPHLAVLLMTGHDDTLEPLSAPAETVLPKPFLKHDLARYMAAVWRLQNKEAS